MASEDHNVPDYLLGTVSKRSRVGGTIHHGFSNGRTCTSTRIGGSTFTGY